MAPGSSNHDSLFLSDSESADFVCDNVSGSSKASDCSVAFPPNLRTTYQSGNLSRSSSSRSSRKDRPTAISLERDNRSNRSALYGEQNERGLASSRYRSLDSMQDRSWIDRLAFTDTASAMHLDTPTLKSPPKIVKEEPEEPESLWITEAGVQDKIKIYVGKRNQVKWATREALSKSPILQSYIIDEATSTEPHSYIMKPQLISIDPTVFEGVVEYIHLGYFVPRSASGRNETFVWEDLSNDDDYAFELVRAGRIYRLAQKFQIEHMPGHVYDKITKVPITKFPLKSLLDLAQILFKSKKSLPKSAELQTTEDADMLEAWLITQLARQMPQIMESHSDQLWIITRQTKHTMFLARLYEEAAIQYRATGGELAGPVINLD